MGNWRALGKLERHVMDHLWSTSEPQTVRQVHAALSVRRQLAYTTVMTVLRRLAAKGLVTQDRLSRAHRYSATHGHDELVADLMIDALDQVPEPRGRRAALLHFVESVRTDDVDMLQSALSELDVKHTRL
ncbi:transcriptional regulator [Mycobacterium sp. 852013-50091_SCH5140682]|uniref:BlaI/MecI/CopY family transcriptional regulator n=1 Tax=Mycobacterium sp. 852013-50091_SCH5140682 TaxID=1834109 RepID=UPI0007EC0A64|nr:BlaI/MecI/CopY family transcriptional regulator [Mycobacterium sp. 852013-50091_SCH5140682]OBC05284.1 transcriptional regulator [Mycobacterium sp. 852013-50091_SCH5140682]